MRGRQVVLILAIVLGAGVALYVLLPFDVGRSSCSTLNVLQRTERWERAASPPRTMPPGEMTDLLKRRAELAGQPVPTYAGVTAGAGGGELTGCAKEGRHRLLMAGLVSVVGAAALGGVAQVIRPKP